jgi:hypothetical protein
VPPGNTATGTNSGDVVETILARSSNGGANWTETQLSSHGSNFNWETHGSARIGFWGDYIYVSAVPGSVLATWTDSRDLVPGADPRETGSADDADGFDIYQRARTSRTTSTRRATARHRSPTRACHKAGSTRTSTPLGRDRCAGVE